MDGFSLVHWITFFLILAVAAGAIWLIVRSSKKFPQPPPVGPIGPLFRFMTYLWRWLFFGAIAGFATPVISPAADGTMPDGYFSHVKLQQIGFGLIFGLVCAIVFTLLQNTLNKQRNRGASWAILVGTWLGVKFAFYGVSAALGA